MSLVRSEDRAAVTPEMLSEGTVEALGKEGSPATIDEEAIYGGDICEAFRVVF